MSKEVSYKIMDYNIMHPIFRVIYARYCYYYRTLLCIVVKYSTETI